MPESRLIVGLGNPGKKYELTRHNLGFLVVQTLAERLHLSFSESPASHGLLAEGQLFDQRIVLLMPTTYMNNAGIAVKAAMSEHGVDVGDILVVSDDLHLPFATMRLRRRGSHGGHNGLSSVIEQLGNGDFARLRCGIGSPADPQETVEYVLKKFSAEERARLDEFVGQAANCCEAWLKEDIETVMNRFNVPS